MVSDKTYRIERPLPICLSRPFSTKRRNTLPLVACAICNSVSTSLRLMLPQSRTSLDDILLDGFSLCRNPKLANVFYRLELIEAYGTGLQKIMDAYKNKTVKPQIIVTTNAFKLILPNCNIDEPISEHNVPKISYQQEEQIINLVRDCGSIKRSDVDTELKVAQATSGRVLRRLVEKGRLKQIGKGRSIRYILSDTM